MLDKFMLKDIINNHFTYEVIELANCKLFYKIRGSPDLATASMNMKLEHTLLHSRVLYEFYFHLDPGQNRYGYPRANSYIPGFWKPDFTPNITDTFWRRVNNQILHLGVERTGESSEKFNVAQTIAIANELLMITKDFLDKLESVDQGFYFGEKLNALKANIDAFIAI